MQGVVSAFSLARMETGKMAKLCISSISKSKFRNLIVRHTRPPGSNLTHASSFFIVFFSRTNTSESRWELVADIEPASIFAKGVLVQHKDWLPGNPFLVHLVEPTQTNTTTTTTTVTLLMSDGRTLPFQGLQKLALVGGRFEFSLVKLNTQGGATLRSTAPLVGLQGTLLSLEWLEEVPDNLLNLDKTMQLVSQAPTDLQASRLDTLRNLTREVCEQRRDFAGVSLIAVGQRLYHPIVSSQIHEPDKLRETLLTLPFVLFNPLLLPSLTKMKRQDREIVRVWLNVAFECFNDRVWTTQCKGLVLLGIEGDGDDEEKLHTQMFMAMFNFLNTIGKWFASQGEYPASTWCHDKNLALSAANCNDDCMAHSLEFSAKAHGRHGNTLAAFRCLEQAMAIQPTESRMKDAQALRASAKNQVGTSGYITPFYSRQVSTDDNGSVWQKHEQDGHCGVCAFCGRGEQKNVATCCRLVCYCNAACQKKHWVRVRKHTCLFGKLDN